MADSKDKGKAVDEQPPADKAAEPKPEVTLESEEESGEEEAGDEGTSAPTGAAGVDASKNKKKKKKSKKIKQMLGMSPKDGDDSKLNEEERKQAHLKQLTNQQLQEYLKLNPALANELAQSGAAGDASSSSHPTDSVAEQLRKLKIQDILTGLASSGKNKKDMASYKFWATQPVPQFGDEITDKSEGPLKVQTVDEIPEEPVDLVLKDQFRWETMDLMDDAQMEEVYKLLNGHYVEDDDAQFRFKYSQAILRWALMSPGWRKDWHVGIRSGKSLCAFISAIPVQIRVRNNVVSGSEVNFLCVHKKLRNKRLAPILIKEITRRCNRAGVFQAIYTGGIVLPRPVSTCRYYHRALDWQKLYDIGFSPLPHGSKPQFQVRKYALPDRTATKGLREMEEKDVDAVYDLLTRYLKHFPLAPLFDKEEITHWLVHRAAKNGDDRVIYSYVVEDPATKKITDFVSFYSLASSVINNAKHSVIKAAYLFYYASETLFEKPGEKAALGARLNELIHDALVLAKKYGFDVFNALSLMQNGLFLEQQKFGPGDGQLHYYLFNYRANPIAGGVDKGNKLDKEGLSGVGFVML